MVAGRSEPAHYIIDWMTLIALSLLAYTMATILHEHLGHGVACVLLGGHPTELGAFYVDCAYTGMSDLGIRLVALAGPFVSLVTGALALVALGRLTHASAPTRYFVWLFATISLMVATGYLLFSGVSGLGDFGVSRDGALYQATPEWLWRILLTCLGLVSYGFVLFLSLRAIEPTVGGEGLARTAAARRLALTSYLTGAVMSILIGLLNPHGLVIVLTSAAASSLGGTSGLFWMMYLLDRKKPGTFPPIQLNRSWSWIVAGLIITLAYAIFLGPTIRP